MPQLPIHLAQGMPDVRMPSTSPDLGVLTATAQDMKRVGAHVGAAVTRIINDRTAASEKTREAQQAMAAMRAFSSATVQAEELKGQLEREADYETVPGKMQEGLKGIFERHAQQLTDPVAQQLFAKDFLRLATGKGVEAVHIRNTGRINRGLADYDATREELKIQAGTADPAEMPFLVSRLQLTHRAAIAGGLVKQQDGVANEQKDLGEIAEGAARQHIDSNPDEAAQQLQAGEGLYRYLDQKQRVILKEHAGTVSRQRIADQVQLDKDTQAAAEKELKAIEAVTERTRKAGVDQAESDALAGKLTLDDVEALRRQRILTGDDYRRVRKAVTEPADLPSDRATRETIALDVESLHPKTTAAQVERLFQHGKLSLKDAVEFKAKIRQRAEGGKSEARTELGQRHNQAEQLIRSGLTTRSPFEALDPVSQEMQTLALLELTRRSSHFDGKEDPLAVASEILPKYQNTLVDRGKLSVTAAQKLVGDWSPDRLEVAKQQGKLSPGQYETIRDALLKLARAQADLEALKARQAAQGKKPQ
jgi:hypothetical protein